MKVWILSRRHRFASRRTVPRTAALIATTVLAVYTCSSLGALPIRAADFTIVALACGAVLMYATSVRWLRNGVLVWFGTISYGLYLWHYFILQLGPPPLIGLGVSIAIAAASWYGIERRFLTPRAHVDIAATAAETA